MWVSIYINMAWHTWPLWDFTLALPQNQWSFASLCDLHPSKCLYRKHFHSELFISVIALHYAFPTGRVLLISYFPSAVYGYIVGLQSLSIGWKNIFFLKLLGPPCVYQEVSSSGATLTFFFCNTFWICRRAPQRTRELSDGICSWRGDQLSYRCKWRTQQRKRVLIGSVKNISQVLGWVVSAICPATED